MNVALNSELQNYSAKLKKHLKLTYSAREADKIMDIISKNIDTFFEENPSATFSDFESNFGSIDEIASSIAETEFFRNSPHKWSTLYYHRKFLKLCTVLIILVSLVISIVYIKGYYDSQKAIPAYEIIDLGEETAPIDEINNNER